MKKNLWKIVVVIVTIILIALFSVFVYSKKINQYNSESINLTVGLEKEIKSLEEIKKNKALKEEAEKNKILEIEQEIKNQQASSTEEVEVKVLPEIKDFVHLKVPFTPQAPLGEWSDERQQDGCEEAVSLMAVYWALGKDLNLQIAKDQIINISKYEEEKYGNSTDTSIADTAERIIKGYFKYNKIKTVSNITKADIINELYKENLVIVPADGRELKNPYYTPPGPERHNLLIIGYDAKSKEFITNDAGTKNGKDYRYKENILYQAISDYHTGLHLPVSQKIKSMIVIWK